MAATPPCFQLEATRGPHKGSTYNHCSTSNSPSILLESLSIGRRKRCWLQLPKDLEVSSVHAEFRSVRDQNNAMRVAICDVTSTNGTKLNGKLLLARQDYPLSDGDLIAVGRTSLRFMKVGHGQLCEKKEKDSTTNASTSAILTSCPPSLPVVKHPAEPVVDAEKLKEVHASPPPVGETSEIVSTNTMKETLADQPENERAPVEEMLTKPVENVVISMDKDESRKEDDDEKIVAQLSPKCVENKLAKKTDDDPDYGEEMLVKPAELVTNENTDDSKKGGTNVEVSIAPSTMNSSATKTKAVEECAATCTKCNEVIGQLDVLEQQAHFNECIGGRVATVAASHAMLSFLSKDAKPKARKRGNAGNGVTRAKKPRKPKLDEHVNDSAAAVTKRKRTRKKADSGEDIVLALALKDISKMDSEQQTDVQLAVTKKKLEQLDEQMAKLAKRRVNLVKTLNRLEKAKEKLRKSQVLPPAKARELLDLKAALDAIFPSNYQAYPKDGRTEKEKTDNGSVVMRYAPSRWKHSGNETDYEEEKQGALAAVAAISMWSRASQQLFGLESDSVLYRNSILRTFEVDANDVGGCIIETDCDKADNEDKDTNVECEEMLKGPSDVACLPPDCTLKPTEETRCDPEVPDFVKRVFPKWQRDLAFLNDQSADEIEVALEEMNDAQAKVVAVTSCKDEDQRDAQEDQRLACDFMGQVMMRLISEKRQILP